MTETKNLKLKTYETATDGQELVARYIDDASDNFQKIDEFCKTDTTLSVEGGIADAKTVGDNVSQLKEDLANKIDKPSTTPEVGKILKVNAVNDDGTFTCEWADAPSGGGVVDDVKINGVSIVDDRAAEIPIADGYNKIGLVKVASIYDGIKIKNGSISCDVYSSNLILAREKSVPVTAKYADLAVKAAMSDGIGAAWTDAERIAALLRMGCTVDDNGFVKWTAQEVSE